MATGGPGGPNLGISKGGGPTVRSFSIPKVGVGQPGAAVTYTFRPPLYTNPRGYEYHVSLRSWAGVKSPPPVAPDVSKVFRGPLYTNSRAPEYNITLRSWFGRLPPLGVVTLPIGGIFIARPPLSPQPAAFGFTNAINLPLTAAPPPPLTVMLGQALL